MAIDLSSNKTMYDDMIGHVAHELECVAYTDPQGFVVNVAVECVTCGLVLLDADRVAELDCNEAGCVYSTGSKDGCTLGSDTYPRTCSELD